MAVSAELVDRLAFAGFSDAHREVLARFAPVLDKELPGILDIFYVNLRRWPELANMFKDGEAMPRAARAQAAHWQMLFSGRFDDAYVESVQRIGLMHSKIGLDPRWYIGGYSFILRHLFDLAARSAGRSLSPASAARTAQLCTAINMAAMIDMDLAISCYIDENKATYDAKLATLAEDFQRQVGVLVDQLGVASNELEASAQSLTDHSGEANTRAMAVAAAAEQASAGVQTVASAAEELSASIQMIATQVADSTRTTQRAVADAERTDQVVRALDEAAERIGTVVGLIGQIAGKTNMLALNASIEAARAGEAGKAFEVVAAEVKALASQTERMTEDVEGQIREIQDVTRQAVSGLTTIAATIGQVAEISDSIAGAVNQQNSATAEISRNIQQTAQAAHEVSANIVGVSHASEATGSAASQVFSSASTLSGQASSLSTQVHRFVTQVRAA
ncbi:chemotaxis protein [Sphingomonas suaedae]|uniref:Chemotaxis protein n=1 Tax=Sphingomonas suaedae TaxID=2599297 RepID=A0A518REB4_9SPHN|nr:globin-coupled sensor protein [Sphingomonas suaedae]QDX25769.1 chemotaxis protein [Sphingomonas suaedae]